MRSALTSGCLVLAMTVSGCSTMEEDIKLAGEAASVDAVLATKPKASGNCTVVTSWYEGFVTRQQIYDGAKRHLELAIESESDKLRRRGWKNVSAEDRKVACAISRPIGIQEWKCRGSAQVCVKGKRATG